MRLAKALLVLALAVAVAVPAYAETQNVKISGSLDSYAFARNNYDLRKGNDSGAVPLSTQVGAGGGGTGSAVHRSEGDEYFMSIAQLQVSADLTDGVSTVVSIVNQRDWNADVVETGVANTGAEYDLGIDLAYVQMKEIFYSPLTLTVGRQDIWLGRGFLIGNNSAAWDPQATILANEYSATTAFDAIRATLDFSPWTVDMLYSKINENSHDPEDDRNLYSTYLTYKFDEYNAVGDLYWVGETDAHTLAAANSPTSDTQTFGGRIQFDPISQLTLGGELAYQAGEYFRSVGAVGQDVGALGLDLFGTYRLSDPWKTELTLEYVSLSGSDGTVTSSEYEGWNSLYRGKFWTAIEDFREVVYASSHANDQPGSTNVEMLQLKGAIKPLDDLALEGSLSFFWNEQSIITNGSSADTEIGWETDLTATYDYTEDVTFGLLAAWFIPGSYYGSNDDARATDIVSSVKVSF